MLLLGEICMQRGFEKLQLLLHLPLEAPVKYTISGQSSIAIRALRLISMF